MAEQAFKHYLLTCAVIATSGLEARVSLKPSSSLRNGPRIAWKSPEIEKRNLFFDGTKLNLRVG